MLNDGKRDVGGMAIAALLIGAGIAVMWDATSMVDSDSFVFPVTVAIVMMGLSAFYIIWNFVRPPSRERKSQAAGSTIRRVGLVVAMLAAAFAMPYTGFVIAGLGAFAAIMVLAMYERWTGARVIIYPLVCVAIVSGFYFLFAKALLVPLPEAPFL